MSSDDRTQTLFRSVAGNVVRISGAIGAAQALTFAGAPVITRLYSPEAFGQFALFGAIVAILSPLASLRYDCAMTMPHERSGALDLLALCQALVVSTSLVVAFACLFLGPILAKWRFTSGDEIMLLPLLTFVIGLQTVMMNWLAAHRAFAQFARVRFATIVGSVACQIGLGQLYPDAVGLIVGFTGGYIIGLMLAAYHCRRALAASATRMRLSTMRRAAVEYRAFALFTVPAHLIGILGSQLPSTILPSLYGLTVAGHYSLAQRVVAQPAVLVGEAVSNVFWSNAAPLFIAEPAQLWALFVRLNACLLMVMTPGFALTWFGPEIFTFLFGSSWREAGSFAGVVIVAACLELAAQGTTSLPSYRLNHWTLGWQIGRVAMLMGAFGAAWQMALSPMICIVAITAAVAISNAALLGLNAVAIWRVKSQAERQEQASAAPITLLPEITAESVRVME